MGETIDLTARPAAYLDGKASRDEVYSAIIGAIGDWCATKSTRPGSSRPGHPLAVFLEADDDGFSFRAEIPIDAAPEGKTQLSPTR